MHKSSKLAAILLSAAALLAANDVSGQFYYGLMQNYGKQRPVFGRFEWNYMRFPGYDVFYYHNGSNNAQYVASILPGEMEKINEMFSGTIDTRLQVICFNSLTDLKQTNILGSADEKYDLSGITQALGDKVFVYGTGDHKDLRAQLRAGLMEAYLNYMVGGGSKNAETIRDIGLSEWFVPGITAFYGSPEISPEMLQKIKDARRTGQLRSMKTYNNQDAVMLGYSVWYYIYHRYGPRTTAQVIISSIANESDEKGIKEVLGISPSQINRDWGDYFSRIFSDPEFVPGKRKKRRLPQLENTAARSKYRQRINDFALSPDGNALAYVVGEGGEYRIFARQLPDGKKRKIVRGGYKIPQNEDLSFPLLAWAGSKNNLAYITEEKGDVFLNVYDMPSKKRTKYRFSQLDKILSMDFSPDGRQAVFSAVRDGYSDIYLYNMRSGALTALTADSYDDLTPRFMEGGNAVVFSSSRPDDTLRRTREHRLGTERKDLFVYDIKNRSDVLKRLSETSSAGESQPVPIGENTVAYLAEGDKPLLTRYAVRLDSVVSRIDTAVHYRPEIRHYELPATKSPLIAHSGAAGAGDFSDLTFYKKRYTLTTEPAPSPNELLHGKAMRREDTLTTEEKEVHPAQKEAYPVDISDYKFEPQTLKRYSGVSETVRQNPYRQVEIPVQDTVLAVQSIDKAYFEKFKRLYRRTYFSTQISASIDNSYQNLDYQPFTGGPVSPPGLMGGMLQFRISDKLEDYAFKFGLRTDFSPLPGYSLLANSEFMVGFDNDKHRLKKGLSYYRRSMVDSYSPVDYVAYVTNLYKVHAAYPLSPVGSVRAEFGFRTDVYRTLSTNQETLETPSVHRNYVTLNLSYTYDNSTYFDLNLRRGLRVKVFAELYQGLYGGPQTMINLGFDARHYMRVHKNIIWANRLAYGTSVGNLKLLYYLGGVDNAFSPKFDQENAASQNYNWGFQTLATNMRGFDQNVRYGSSFAVFNSELRIPLFQYLSRSTIRFAPIRHFQIVPFFDAGSAWTAATPWDADNEYNKKQIQEGDITIILNRSLDPFIYGYGVGLRTSFFGYFLRADWAWGHDSGFSYPRKFYFSLGFDF